MLLMTVARPTLVPDDDDVEWPSALPTSGGLRNDLLETGVASVLLSDHTFLHIISYPRRNLMLQLWLIWSAFGVLVYLLLLILISWRCVTLNGCASITQFNVQAIPAPHKLVVHAKRSEGCGYAPLAKEDGRK